jgi:hypothetical protein
MALYLCMIGLSVRETRQQRVATLGPEGVAESTLKCYLQAARMTSRTLTPNGRELTQSTKRS